MQNGVDETHCTGTLCTWSCSDILPCVPGFNPLVMIQTGFSSPRIVWDIEGSHFRPPCHMQCAEVCSTYVASLEPLSICGNLKTNNSLGPPNPRVPPPPEIGGFFSFFFFSRGIFPWNFLEPTKPSNLPPAPPSEQRRTTQDPRASPLAASAARRSPGDFLRQSSCPPIGLKKARSRWLAVEMGRAYPSRKRQTLLRAFC